MCPIILTVGRDRKLVRKVRQAELGGRALDTNVRMNGTDLKRRGKRRVEDGSNNCNNGGGRGFVDNHRNYLRSIINMSAS